MSSPAKRISRCASLALAVPLLAVTLTAERSLAQPRTDRGGTILLFLKVAVDADTETAIEVTNIHNIRQTARCFYLDGRPVNQALPPSGTNPPVWTRQEFTIELTRQQPTFWLASQGRAVDARDDVVGLDPGAIPPLPLGYRGELVCLAVDDTNVVLGSNALVGVATVYDGAHNDTSKYNAVSYEATENYDFDDSLCLGAGAPGCPLAEYDPCPQASLFDHLSPMYDDPVIGSGSSTDVALTLATCAQNLSGSTPASASITLFFTDTFENSVSSSVTMAGWIDAPLSTFVNPSILSASTFYRTRVASSAPVLALVQQLHTSPGVSPAVASSMNNGFVTGQTSGTFVIPAP